MKVKYLIFEPKIKIIIKLKKYSLDLTSILSCSACCWREEVDVPGGGVGCCTFDPLFPVGCGLAAAALATEESESLCLLMLELRDLMVCGREREREREYMYTCC